MTDVWVGDDNVVNPLAVTSTGGCSGDELTDNQALGVLSSVDIAVNDGAVATIAQSGNLGATLN